MMRVGAFLVVTPYGFLSVMVWTGSSIWQFFLPGRNAKNTVFFA